MAEGPEAGLRLIDDVAAELDGFHPLHAARADLLRRAGRRAEAAAPKPPRPTPAPFPYAPISSSVATSHVAWWKSAESRRECLQRLLPGIEATSSERSFTSPRERRAEQPVRSPNAAKYGSGSKRIELNGSATHNA
jgi:hypothetical protein